MTAKRKVYEALCLLYKGVVEGSGYWTNDGICNNVKHVANNGRLTGDIDIYLVGRVLHPLFESWPKFSGNVDFPVPDPDGVRTPCEAYINLTKWCSDYGALRVELLKHCITTLGAALAMEERIDRV